MSELKHNNILVIMTDDHGPWALKSRGCEILRTPNLDLLADQGVQFTRAYTPNPVCSPSRACFFTGRYPSQHGIHDWLDGNQGSSWMELEVNLAQKLKQQGYRTGLVGKWHCGDDAHPQTGFDYWCSFSKGIFPFNGKVAWGKNGKQITSEGQQAEFITREALHFMEDPSTNPFFLFVGFADTHSPFCDHPQDIVNHYKEALSETTLPTESHDRDSGWIRFGVPHTKAEQLEWMAQYLAAVEMIDRQVGTLIAQLKASGQLENTLIVYTSDHGHMNGHHGLYTKSNATVPANFYEESIHVPLIIRLPSTAYPGRTCSHPVSHCDLHQTIIEAASVRSDSHRQSKENSPGISYYDYLQSNHAIRTQSNVYCELGNSRMVRNERYKLIVHYPITGQSFPPELYDLVKDPRESMNLANDPSCSGIFDSLKNQLETFYQGIEEKGKSGLDILDQKVHNPWEIWRMNPPQKWDSEGSEMNILRAYVKAEES